MNDDLRANPLLYGVAGSLNAPPPAIPTDPVAHAGSIFDQLLAVLGLAANLGDPADTGQSQLEQADRELKTADAQFKFPANEEQSAAELAGVSQQGQLAQSFPQLASGVAGGIGAALQPLNQLTQQLAQVGQQSLQSGLSALQQGAGGEAFDADDFADDFGDDAGALDRGSEGDEYGGGRFGGGTAPAAMLGPPPNPSAATVPASVRATPATEPGTPPQTTAATGGVSAMPTVAPGGLPGAGGAGSDAKADAKRVVVPSMKNGAPVQGRIAIPPPTPAVTKRVQGKIAATRIVLADQNADNDDSVR